MNMRIMMAELRKIWRPGMVLLLCFLGAIYYYLFMHFDIWYFKSEMFREAEMELAMGWINTYGTTLEPEERLDLERQNAEEIAAFNQQIAAIPEAQAAGITDYMSFMAYHEGSRSEAMQQQGKVDMDAEALIWHIIGRTNYPRLQALQLTMERYDVQQSADYYTDHGIEVTDSARRKARIQTLSTSPWRNSILPQEVLENTWSYGGNLLAWMVLSCLLLVSPLLVRDRMADVRQLQWTTRTGRRIFHRQLAAVLLSACVLSVMNLLIFGSIYLTNHTLIFRDCRMFSFLCTLLPWVDWTYGQYFIVLVLMLFGISIAAAGFAFLLAQYSSHYVGMLLKLLPLFAVLRLLGGYLFQTPFFFRAGVDKLHEIPGLEGWIAVGLLVLALGLCLFAARHQRQKE